MDSSIARVIQVGCRHSDVFCDRQPEIASAHTTGYHARSKYLDVKYKFLAERVENNEIRLLYKPTSEMLADTLTKALPRATVENFVAEMGLSV